MSARQHSFRELLRTSWQDWSGFLRFVVLSGVAGGAFLLAFWMADWVTGLILGRGDLDPLALVVAKGTSGVLFASLVLLADMLLGCVRTSRGSLLAAWVNLFTLGFVLNECQLLGTEPSGLGFLIDMGVTAVGFFVGWKWKPWKMFWPLDDPLEDHDA